MNLLVVENNKRHIASAKKFFAEKGIQAKFVETLESFNKSLPCNTYDPVLGEMSEKSFNEDLRLHGYDGVLSDIFFPNDDEEYTDEVPAGVAVLFICQSRGIPCVLVTDGYHHGKKYQWIHYMLNELRLPLMIDNMGDDSEAPEKNWAMALKSLASVIGHKQCLILGAE